MVIFFTLFTYFTSKNYFYFIVFYLKYSIFAHTLYKSTGYYFRTSFGVNIASSHLSHSSVPLHDDDFCPDLVIDCIPLPENLLHVVLQVLRMRQSYWKATHFRRISSTWSCKYCACVSFSRKHPTSGESPARVPASISRVSDLMRKHPTSGESPACGPASIRMRQSYWKASHFRESPARGPANIAHASDFLRKHLTSGGNLLHMILHVLRMRQSHCKASHFRRISCTWSCNYSACVNLTVKHPTSGESPAYGPASIAHASILLESIPEYPLPTPMDRYGQVHFKRKQ